MSKRPAQPKASAARPASPPSPAFPPALMSLPTLAVYCDVSVRTVEAWRSMGVLPPPVETPGQIAARPLPAIRH